MPFSTSSRRTSLPNSFGLCAFPLRITCVCGSNKLSTLPSTCVLPSHTRCLVWEITFSTKGRKCRNWAACFSTSRRLPTTFSRPDFHWVDEASLGAEANVIPPWPFSQVFDSRHQTVVVVADSNHGMFRILTSQPGSLNQYLRREFLQLSPILKGSPGATLDAGFVCRRRGYAT